MEWTGNLTMIMDGKKDVYAPGSIEVGVYSNIEIKPMTITITSEGEKAKAIIRLSLEECKKLIIELMQKL